MKNKLYRQGDVLIERVAKQNHTTAKKLTRVVLAEGEATGHHHLLETVDPADWWKEGDTQFVQLAAPATVTHEEHGPITLRKATYQVIRQREYTPQAIVNVRD